LKKIFYSFLLFFIVLILSIVFAANSSYVIKKAAEYFAPEYKITYDDITGNILTGVTIKELKFEGDPVSKSIKFRWDPSRLLYKSIAVNELEIDALDTNVLKRLIASFPSDDNSSSKPFDFAVSVGKIHFSVNPFTEQGILVSKTVLDMKDIYYATNVLQIKDFALLADSNMGGIDISGSLIGDTLRFEHIVLKDMDMLVLQKFFASENNKRGRMLSADQNRMKQSEPSPLIPRTIILGSLHANVLPVTYDPVHVLKLLLNVKNARFNVEKRLVENASVDLNATTDLSNVKQRGQIRNNQLTGKIELTPNKKLFELYDLPLRKEAIGDIAVDFNATKERITADIRAKAKHVLISKKGEFDLDINSLLSHVVYVIDGNTLTADSKLMITTPYAENISVTNIFKIDGKMSYKGEIKAKELTGINAKFTKPLNHLNIQYTGDSDHAGIEMRSDGLKGSFDSADLEKGHLHLETTKAIALNEMMNLPEELNASKANVIIDAPLDLRKITPIKAKARIVSNVANIDADIVYDKTLRLKATSMIPKDSLLRSFDKKIQWNAIDPLMIDATLADKNVTLELKSKALTSNLEYFLDNGKVDGEIKLAGLTTEIKGIAQKKITINAKADSIKSLQDSIRSFYAEDLPPLEGTLDLSAELTAMRKLRLSLVSPKMIYRPDQNTEHLLNDMKVVADIDKQKVLLESYKVTYDKMKFFSTKPSVVNMKGDIIEVSPLWLNDQLKVIGTYNTKTRKGKLSEEASSLHIAHGLIDLDSAVRLETLLDGNKTSIRGEVTLLGGNIYYDLRQKTFALDSDIVIVQDRKKEKQSTPFMEELSISVKIKTKKPLVYKQGDMNMLAKVDMGIEKAEGGPVLFLGMVELPAGGSYIFQDKKFILKKSFIYFTGDINKPILDIKAEYKTVKYLITVSVTGTPALPNIIFNSVPHLTKEQILSVILFDSEVGAENNSGEDMMKMMGGAMAKSALSNAGIKIDHLVLGAGNSVEVGKKLTDKITIIYINDEVSSVRLKYDYSQHIEGTITVSPKSSSGDIFYKKDF